MTARPRPFDPRLAALVRLDRTGLIARYLDTLSAPESKLARAVSGMTNDQLMAVLRVRP